MKSGIPARTAAALGVMLTAAVISGTLLIDIWLPGGTAAAGIEVGRLLAARKPAVTCLSLITLTDLFLTM